MQLNGPGNADDQAYEFRGKGSAGYDMVGGSHWGLSSDATDERQGITNVRAYCISPPGDAGVYFAPPWQVPYQTTTQLGLDAPFITGCPGDFALSFDYDFESGVDTGHALFNGSVKQYSGKGQVSAMASGPTHWAIFTSSGSHHLGFTNIRAVCH